VHLVSEHELYEDQHYQEKDINLYVRLDNKANKVVGVKWAVIAIFIIVTILSVIPYPIIKNITECFVFIFITVITFLMSLLKQPVITAFILIIVIHYFLSWYIHKVAFNIVLDQVNTNNEEETIHLDIDNKKNILKTFRVTRDKTVKRVIEKTNGKHSVVIRFLKQAFKILITPDFYFATVYKKHLRSLLTIHPCSINKDCKHSYKICYHQWDSIKIAKKYFIQFSNWINIITVSLLGIIVLILHEHTVTYFDSMLLGIIVFRIFSRFIELSIAFYKDNVPVNDKIFKSEAGIESVYIHRWKNSLLLKSSRISLAVHSLIEVIILFSLFYFLASNVGFIEIPFSKPAFTVDNDLGITILEDNYKPQFTDYLLYTISVTAMNFSFDPTYVVSWLGLAHIVQVILSLVLIVLSIASYIGLENTLSKREESFYLATHTKADELKAKKHKNNDISPPSETDSSKDTKGIKG
jgi:hypothetical protein